MKLSSNVDPASLIKMGLQKNTDPRYELLQEDRSFNPTLLQSRVNTIWVAFCLVGLLITVIMTFVYLTCSNFSETFTSSKLIEMDFVIFGPQKVVKGDYKVMKHRAEKYSFSTFKNANSTKWNSNTVQTSSRVAQEFKYIPKAYKLVCYYTLPKNVTTGQLLPSNLDPNLCSHLIIGFAYIDNTSNPSIVPGGEADYMVYSQVVALKHSNPSLKVLISIACNDQNGRGLLNAINSVHSRRRFTFNMIAFLDKHSLDGIDFDWEFPSWPDNSFVQKENFALLLEDIKLIFNSARRPNGRYILSVAVAAPASIIDQAYNVSRMARAVDFINLMAYDYHYWTAYLPLTGPNAPLYPAVGDYNYFATLNGNWSIHKWMDEGMPPEKIVFGVPTYAHTFELYNSLNHDFNSPASGFSKSVGYEGFASYGEVCRFLNDSATNIVFDHATRTPYAYKNEDWISYDNNESLAYKANYVTTNGLGGIMVWALNLDDYDGMCGGTSFPLIKQLNKTLNEDFL